MLQPKHKNCWSNFALSKPIIDNVVEDLWRLEKLHSSEFTHFDRSPCTRSRIERVHTDIKIANNTKINHKMIFFTDQCYAIFTDRLPSKIKITKEFDNFILCTTDFWKTIKNLISLLKRKKNNYSSTSEWCKKIFFKTLKRQNLQNETIS